MHSLLLVAPDGDTDVEKAFASGAGAIILDLVRNVDAADARQRIAAWLRAARKRAPGPALYVRIAALKEGRADADLDAVMPERPDGIVLSGAHAGADIQHLSVKLGVHEARHGWPDGTTKIMASAAETPAAVFQLGSYVGASRRLSGLMFGGAPLASALGIERSDLAEGASPLALARSLMLFAAGAANAAAIDAASPASSDEGALRHACEAARRYGFSGKLAVDADQIATINAVFAEAL